MAWESGRPAPLVLWILFTLGAAQDVLDVYGRDGESVELSCPTGEIIGSKQVTWRRSYPNETLANLTMGPGNTFWGRLGVIHRGALSVVVYNITLRDSGAYSCSKKTEQTGIITNLRVRDNCTMDNIFFLNSTANQRSTGPNEFPTGNLTACAGDDVWIQCHLPGNGAQRRKGQREKVQKLLNRVMLRPGYGVTLLSGASLIIVNLAQRHRGTYTCRINQIERTVRLHVEKPDFLEFLLEWWVPLTTVTCSLCLYASLLAVVLQLRRRHQQRAHKARISRMLSFFKRELISDEQLNGTYRNQLSPLSPDGAVTQGGSGSTSYENLGSGDGEVDNRSQSCHLQLDQDVGISYENLNAEQEADIDDYLDPNTDSASSQTEDYMEPDGEMGERQQTTAQINFPTGLVSDGPVTDCLYTVPKKKAQRHDAGRNTEAERAASHYANRRQLPQGESEESSEEDYAVPDTDSPTETESGPANPYGDREPVWLNPDRDSHDSEMYEPMDRCRITEQTQQQMEDYEKMGATLPSGRQEELLVAGDTPEEEYMRMERCRNMFVQKFKLNASRYNRDEDVGHSLKTHGRSYKPFETFGYPKTENVPE